MGKVRCVTTDEGAVSLAALLNGDTRTRPTAVITTPSQSQHPFIDAEKMAAELEGLADVYLIETGPFTWAFSSRMVELTQVYGGAGRVYPVDHGWITDPGQAPLRFAFNSAEGKRATHQLIDDALSMAAAAGLLDRPTATGQRAHVDGIVRGIVGERAWVDLTDGRNALVPPLLAEPDVPIERALRRGMVVSGWLDLRRNWLDVRETRLSAEQALAGYQVGDVVLALVDTVGASAADVLLHPDLRVRLTPREVAGDDGTDLRALLTHGEVLTVLLEAVPPAPEDSAWRLRVVDATARPAASLYAGGPPWLEPPAEAPELFEPAPQPPKPKKPSAVDTVALPRTVMVAPPTLEPMEVAAPAAPAAPAPAAPAPAARAQPGRPVAPAAPPAAHSSAPSPLMLDPKRRSQMVPSGSTRSVQPAPGAPVAPAAAAAAPAAAVEPKAAKQGQAVESMALKVSALEVELRNLRGKVTELEGQVSGLEQERTQLLGLRAEAEHTANRTAGQLQQVKSQLRKAKSSKPATGGARPEFADRERGFRYLVETAWATRTPVGEQPSRPLRSYEIGPAFLASIEALDGIAPEKVADVVFEIVTKRAEESAGRDMHRLRTGPGGDDPVRVREDGSVCWRVAIQRNTASARRLHFWQRPDGTIELSRVVLHDDMQP